MRARVPAVFAAFISTVAVAAASAGPAAAVSTDQSYWVPLDKRVVVRGHGYGHGHGMSQYGAQGAALKGKSYKEIVDFYYPGTSWSKVRGLVRVLITADTTSNVVVGPTAGLTVRDRATRKTYELPRIKGVQRWALNGVGAKTRVSYLTNRWHRFRPGGKAALAGSGELFAAGPITLWTPSGSRAYRGTLRSAPTSQGSSTRDTVNVLTMDRYVMGVVPYEMPASWSPEAVKAQAVAARTYATWSRAQNPRRYYQICDTTACQVYNGATGEDSRSNQAVKSTRRQILTYDGRPAFTQFSSSSGGWTAAGSVPYLSAKQDPYDGWAGNPVHDWSLTIDAGRFERSYPSLGTLRRVRVVSRDGNGDWEGRVNNVLLDGTRSDVTISGDEFRWAFGLRSSWFTIDPTAIISRWARIGGERSRLGAVTSREYKVESGAAQDFRRGRIYDSPRTGPRELYGPILKKFRHVGGPGSELGFPVTRAFRTGRGLRVRFQNGVIFSREGVGTVPLTGAIARRYLADGGIGSPLGWPTRRALAVPGGLRANFQHGYLAYSNRTKRVRVHLDG